MKKRFLELLIKSMGLIPNDVKSYRTDGCGGQYEIGIGWMGEGLNKKSEVVFEFEQPDGFNDAVAEILKFIHECPEDVDIQTDWDFKV